MSELLKLLASVSALYIQGAPAQDSAATILARAAEAYQAVKTLRSEFVQRIEIRALEREKEGRGVVYQKKPNYFLMRFEEPKGDVVVADGEWFWMYYPSAQPDQVVRTAINRTAEGATLGGEFLVNPTQRYVATYIGRESVGDRPAHLLSLVPKFEAPYTLVRVWIDAQDYLVRKFQVFEENETVRTITLRNVEAGIDLPDELFHFTPPPGVEVFTR
jgi:outer membrane lipoprotein-sorting protein